MPAKLVSLIETETYRGQGIPSDPSRIVRQWFTPEGELVVESDKWAEGRVLDLLSREAGFPITSRISNDLLERCGCAHCQHLVRGIGGEKNTPLSLHRDADAQRWAFEWMQLFHTGIHVTGEWMTTWFSNAIQCGIDHERRAHEQKMAAVAHPAGSGGTGGQQMYVTPAGGAPTSTGSLVGTGTLRDLQGDYTRHSESQFCQCAECLAKKNRIW